MAGRYAPSPSGDLHLGNLRTALVAWLAARSTGRAFLLRVDDLDAATSSEDYMQSQQDDLRSLGIDWDHEPIRQSTRFDRYRGVIDQLATRGEVYPCYCSRRQIRDEIEQATRAPHAHLPDGAYPGTCRDLTETERVERAASSGRDPAWRLRTEGEMLTVDDRIAGTYEGMVDDMVVARADGTPSYNLAVVVDDHDQGVSQVVRGDDLLTSTPRHQLVARRLGWAEPEYWHVPLVMVDATTRLAKRDGPVTLANLREQGWSAAAVLASLARSLQLAAPGEHVTADRLIERFDPATVPREPVLVSDLIDGR